MWQILLPSHRDVISGSKHGGGPCLFYCTGSVKMWELQLQRECSDCEVKQAGKGGLRFPCECRVGVFVSLLLYFRAKHDRP